MRMPEDYMELIMFGEIARGDSSYAAPIDQQYLVIPDFAALQQFQVDGTAADTAVVIDSLDNLQNQFLNTVDR